MNKLNSKTTRIVSALALSAGLFSVSNSAMAASCSSNGSRYCVTGDTGVTTATLRKVVATATSKHSITGRGEAGAVLIKNSRNDATVASKNFVGSTSLTYVSQITGQKYHALVGQPGHGTSLPPVILKATINLKRV